MIVKIDTREQKTPKLWDIAQSKHPIIFKQYTYKIETLYDGVDLETDTMVWQIKWGNDYLQSLNNKKLEAELQAMHKAFYGKKGLGLMISDSYDYHMSMSDFKRGVGLCQEYGVIIKHDKQPYECLTAMIQYEFQPIPLARTIIEGTRKNAGIISAFVGLADGISRDFAEYLIPDGVQSIRKLLEYIDNLNQECRLIDHINAFYGRNMQALYNLVCEVMGL